MGLLEGLNPVAGLYGYLVGTVAGAVAMRSLLMSVQATGAMAVLIANVPRRQRIRRDVQPWGDLISSWPS